MRRRNCKEANLSARRRTASAHGKLVAPAGWNIRLLVAGDVRSLRFRSVGRNSYTPEMADRSASRRSRSRSQNARENIRENVRVDVTYRVDHPKQGKRIMHSTGEPVAEDGKVTRLIGNTLDITEQEKCNPRTEEGVRGNQGTEGRALQRKHCPAPRNRKHVDV